MSIQRWNMRAVISTVDIEKSPSGMYVKYEDYAEELSTLKARCDELLEAAKDILELYDDDIGMEAFPCATQVEIKSTTLGVLRNFRAAIANAEEAEE